MRKILFSFSKVFIFILLFFGLFTAKNVFAVGTCTCSVNQSRSWFLLTNNCDPVTEYPSGCVGSAVGNPNAKCECINKENSGLPANTCTCNGSRVILTNTCQDGTLIPTCNTQGSVLCICTATGSFGSNQPNPDDSSSCTTDKGVITSLGCIPTEMDKFASWLLQYIFGIAGGIAFLLMVYGFVLMATSSGDDKKLQGARETVTSAITGLLVSIFALFLFRLIAVNILHIPGIN